MKYFAVFLGLLVTISAATVHEVWSEFKKNHGKNYKSVKEENQRFEIFQNTLRKIEEHNAKYDKGEKTYYLGINQFSDWTQDEYASILKYNKTVKIDKNHKSTSLDEVSIQDVPSSVDWRMQGVVTGVKNQGNCGSCWAFSATGALEGAYAIRTGSLISLSEQNLLDCTSIYGNAGCDGGYIQYAFQYVIDNGIELESDYPYQAVEGWCQYSSYYNVLQIGNYQNLVSGSEDALQRAVATVGPISVAMDASSDYFSSYAGGIFYEPYCSSTQLNHGVLVVGYGEEAGTPYWLVKNSWGTTWGEGGYFKIPRNYNNICGLATDATYPIIY